MILMFSGSDSYFFSGSDFYLFFLGSDYPYYILILRGALGDRNIFRLRHSQSLNSVYRWKLFWFCHLKIPETVLSGHHDERSFNALEMGCMFVVTVRKLSQVNFQATMLLTFIFIQQAVVFYIVIQFLEISLQLKTTNFANFVT